MIFASSRMLVKKLLDRRGVRNPRNIFRTERGGSGESSFGCVVFDRAWGSVLHSMLNVLVDSLAVYEER